MGRRLNGKSQKPNKKVIDNIPKQNENMTDQSTESALGHQKRKHVLMHTKVFTDTSRSCRKKHKPNESKFEDKEGSSDRFLKDCVRNISELRVQDSINFRSQRKASSHPSPETEEGLSDVASQSSDDRQADKGDDRWSNFCLTCHEPGTLLCCEGQGCSKTYHLKCLDPPLQEVPSGVWLCSTCINSVSRSITSRDDLVVLNRTSAQPDGENQGVCNALTYGVENLAKKQSDLHTCLQIHLLKLCQAAGLPEYVNTMAEDLLEYVIYKFKIDSEPAVVLQATILSLFWRAASLFKHWLDPEDLVKLAYNVLQYECDVNLVNLLYSSFKILRTEFQPLADFIPVEFSNQFLKVPKLEVVAYPEAAHCDEVVRTTACQNLRWDTQLQLEGFYTNAPGTSADATIKGVQIKEEQNYMTLSSQEPSASADPSLLELNRIKQQSECLATLHEMKMFNYQKELEQELAEVKRSLEKAYKKEDLRYQREKQHLDEIEDEILQILAGQGGSNKFH
ncbi:Autoimmune regulator [Carex littledalei]|uniref:Autoimmune regulator n=1 Tax=Carex littledalei TaxID=544730 RepID=A0A833R8P3_9POAL|nr:Autoimmune regulator [Carex littledalei]